MFFDRLFEIIAQCFEWFVPFVVIRVYEGAVQLRQGKRHKILRGGFHWVVPFGVDHVIHENINWQVKPIGLQSLFTKDGHAVSLNAVATHRIGEGDEDIARALLEVDSVEHALLDACAGAIGAHVASHTWDELRTEDTPNELSKVCRRNGKRFGIEIERIQLRDLTPAGAYRLLSDRSDPLEHLR